MDMRSWKKVLLNWINECGFMECSYYNIEQSDIDAFYQNFSLKHQKTATGNYKHLDDFLKEFYPSFELNFNDEKCLSSADYIYVYSLLLHFCCVKHPDTVFHKICERLPDQLQQYIAIFFKEFIDTDQITKDVIRRAIEKVAKCQVTPPRFNDSFSSSTASVSGLSSASYSRCESPLKTPKHCAGPQRISPSTPKTFLLEERIREVFTLKAQLETERYEKALLEEEIKQNEEKIKKLNNDYKRLLQQIQDLRNDIFLNNSSDGSSNCDKEKQVQNRLLKELAHKEQEITNLSENIRTLGEEKSSVEKKRNQAEKENIFCVNRIKELDCTIEELMEELEKRNDNIKFLTEKKLELEQFIAETRASNNDRDFNETLDSSFLSNSNNANSSYSVSSPENLGASVIDIQLKEKDHENQLLKEELRNVKREHKRLAKHLTKLTEEYDVPLDSSSPNRSEYSEEDNEVVEEESEEENFQNNKISSQEQLNLFKYCMEKINKFHKTEKNKFKQLEQKTNNLQEEKQDLAIKLLQLNDEIENLKNQLNLEKDLAELREKLEDEEVIMEKRVYQEVKRLEGDLFNLEELNERLANENVKIQVNLGNIEQDLKDSKLKIKVSEEESLQLKEQLRNKSVVVERLQQEEKKLQQSFKEKQQQSEKITEKLKHLEVQLKDKISKIQNLERECQELKEKANRNQQKISHYQQLQQSQQTEHKQLQEKLKVLQTSNESMELEMDNLNKELLALKNKNTELLQQYNEVEQSLHLTTKKLDEMTTTKLNIETKCKKLQSESQQLKRNLEFVKDQQQTQQDDNNRLLQEIDLLKIDKQHLKDEINENKTTLQRSNDNVSQLIQQISSVRLEKEAALKEIQLLRKQMEETGKHQSTSETKMKSIIEKSQELERKQLAAENELKSLKVNFEKSESTAEKLRTENKKLRDSHEVSTKRIEKFALKLGDSQARCAKLERDNEKLSRTLEAHTATVEALQREKDLLQAEAKSLKERVSRAERGHEQLVAKKQNLEHQITSLQQIKQKLEASEIENKIKINKLEKLREVNEEKLRKLTDALNNAENANVKLYLDVGSLNSQIQEIKVEHKQEQQENQHKQIEELDNKLEQVQELANTYEELKKLKIEINNLKEENSSLNDQFSKTSLSLQIASKKYKEIVSELEELRAEILIIRREKLQIELQNDTSIQKLSRFESENTNLLVERKNLIKSFKQRIANLEEKLTLKTKEVADLQKEIEALKENCKSHALVIQQNTTANLSELEELRTKLSLAKEIRQKEQKIISELRMDNQILHTKYQESKKRALDAEKSNEERIKENRLELEGKLEKMKNKMYETTTRTVGTEKHWKKRIHLCFRYLLLFLHKFYLL